MRVGGGRKKVYLIRFGAFVILAVAMCASRRADHDDAFMMEIMRIQIYFVTHTFGAKSTERLSPD